MTDTKSGNDRSAQFEQRAQALLRESAELLDGQTRSRLTQARHAALDAIGNPAVQQRQRFWRWLAPVSGIAATAALAIIIAVHPVRRDDRVAAGAAVDELEIVTAEDSLEFYRDIEFYTWLDTVLEQDPAEEAGA